MKPRKKPVFLMIVLALLLIPLAGPFLIPVPPLDGLLPPQALADPDSQFIQLNGLDVHVKTLGQGEPVFVLLHGFGASLYSWQAVIEPLSQSGTVIAYDRPAFGLTERPLTWEGQNPYGSPAQVDLLIALLDHFGVEQAVLVGNSAGGTVAMQAAIQHPERVAALILVDPAVYTSRSTPEWIMPVLHTPQARRLGLLAVRSIQTRGPKLLNLAWDDPTQIPPESIEQYQKPLQVENWDRALWEFTLAARPADLEDRLDQLTLPTLVITGDNDQIVPTADSIRLAGELPSAQLVVIQNAGHVPHEERPQEFLDAISAFLSTIDR
ncbi:MAG TPA: alpha/beta hydrolase [Anaerolineaceae bacterium]|nr:alpha/beta hydrolase [Anaerolineaceae bacterium]HQH85025.1 alpha/beta hydrolase [Anaerolineaceae bacterium]